MQKKPTSKDIADFEVALGSAKEGPHLTTRGISNFAFVSKHVFNTTFSCRRLLGQLGATKVTEWHYKRWPRVKVGRLHG